MSDFEELDPSIHNALRDVPPASASLRDAHIAAALGEMAPSSRRAPGRLRILGSVAAASVLAVAGLSVFRQNAADNNQISVNSTLPPKTGANCTAELAELRDAARDSKEFSHLNETYVVMVGKDNIEVYRGTAPCSNVGALDYRGASVARDNEMSPSGGTSVCSDGIEPIASFTDTAAGEPYGLVLLHTDRGLALYFKDRCDSPIATLDLP
jgi:hypothetical protein